jgi:hypothetical protein
MLTPKNERLIKAIGPDVAILRHGRPSWLFVTSMLGAVDELSGERQRAPCACQGLHNLKQMIGQVCSSYVIGCQLLIGECCGLGGIFVYSFAEHGKPNSVTGSPVNSAYDHKKNRRFRSAPFHGASKFNHETRPRRCTPTASMQQQAVLRAPAHSSW